MIWGLHSNLNEFIMDHFTRTAFYDHYVLRPHIIYDSVTYPLYMTLHLIPGALSPMTIYA